MAAGASSPDDRESPPACAPGANVRFPRLRSVVIGSGIPHRLLAGSIIAPAVVPRLETGTGLCDLRPIRDAVGNRPPGTDAVTGQRAGAGSAARQIELPENAEFVRQPAESGAERIFVERHEDLAAVGQFCKQLIDSSGIDAVHEQRYVAQRRRRPGKGVRAAPGSSLRQSS